MTIGKNIQKFRKLKGLTQTELAEMLGTTQYVITNYERDLNNPITAKMPEIAKVLEVTLDELYGIKSSPKKEKASHKNTREKQIEDVFSKLSPAHQRAVLSHAKGLIK